MAERIKHVIGSAKGKVYAAILALVLLALLCAGGYVLWLYSQPRFHGLTLELGSELPEVGAFLTEYAKPEKAQLITEQADIDMTLVGNQTLTFQHGRRTETVTLTIVDTTAPMAVFCDVTARIDQVPAPEDFVEEVLDLSEVTVAFAQELTVPESYGDVSVEIVVEDAYGNATTGQCKLFYVWLRPSYTLELGDQLKKSDLLLDADKDAALISQAVLNKINNSSIGTYMVTSKAGDYVCECVVTVQDTTAPVLVLKEAWVPVGQTAELEDFIESVSDNSGEVTTRLITALDFDTIGTQTVVIEAEDPYGNITTMETNMSIVTDTTPPSFSEMSSLEVEKNGVPDYTSGISAYDSKDGEVSFTYDASRVDLAAAGTYYVVYSAKDNDGNVGTYRRKVVVLHDAEDTAALAASIAAGLSSDPEAIRDYVRDTIYYSHDWGGEDPVWYGFKNQTGNCYVHALCLQALLTEKGYTTQLIWVTDQSHYWLLINLNGQWRHIDATPGSLHSRYSLMTDEQRYDTLSGRDWDRSAWPTCE